MGKYHKAKFDILLQEDLDFFDKHFIQSPDPWDEEQKRSAQNTIIQNKKTIKNKRIRLRNKILKKNLERMLTEMIRNGFTKAKKAEEDFKGG